MMFLGETKHSKITASELPKSFTYSIAPTCTFVIVKAFYPLLLILIVSYKFSIYHQPKPGCRALVVELYSQLRGSSTMRYGVNKLLFLLLTSVLTKSNISFLRLK